MPYLRPWRRDGIICPAFPTKESLILDSGEGSQSSRHRAEAGRDGVPSPSAYGQGQNLGKPQLVGRLVLKPPQRIKAADRGAGKSRKDPGMLRIQRRVASSENRKFSARAKYDGASRGNHAACFRFLSS